MTLPRPALLAVLGGVLILAVFALTRTVGEADDGGAPAPVAEAPAPAAEKPAAQEDEAEPKPAAERPADDGVPAALERAIARGGVAVLAFVQADGAEDAAVRAAVESLRGVPTFVDDVRDVGDYQELVGELDVDRAPAVVVIAGRKARVLEGYVDPGTLAQQVEDAR